MTKPRAADNFAFIRQRMNEIKPPMPVVGDTLLKPATTAPKDIPPTPLMPYICSVCGEQHSGGSRPCVGKG